MVSSLRGKVPTAAPRCTTGCNRRIAQFSNLCASPCRLKTAYEFDTPEQWAAGYRFAAESGRRVQIELVREDGAESAELFVDLYQLDRDFPRYVSSAPAVPSAGPAPLSQQIAMDVVGADDYIVRVQPGLLKHVGQYRLAIRLEPQLQFPVTGHSARSIQSGFGAARDGGAREHHGVDIFAPRGTRVIAALDARVSRVDTTNLGGKVVWLQPLFGSTRLYYAHLDSQSVEPGQYVFAGETIGTVGNTGNARSTPPHLHFGVYIRTAAVRALPTRFLRRRAGESPRAVGRSRVINQGRRDSRRDR